MNGRVKWKEESGVSISSSLEDGWSMTRSQAPRRDSSLSGTGQHPPGTGDISLANQGRDCQAGEVAPPDLSWGPMSAPKAEEHVPPVGREKIR